MSRAAAIALIVALAACDGASPSPSVAEARTTPPPPAQVATPLDASRRTAITSAVQRVAPAVVTVQTETKERVPIDIFEQIYGGRSGERTSAGIGSGFILRADGVIVTNAHVVTGATAISVAMRDGTTHDAKIVGVDEQNDIAVLRITARDLPVAPLGNSTDVIVGEWAIAIGNPFGFVLGNAEPSVTAGVISGTGRNLVAQSTGGGITRDMIQTDAAINPGNSGGPLVNAAGEVIGVNTVIYTPSQGSVGLGFAVPINRVKRVADDLLAHGSVRRPWIGVRLRVPQANNPREALAMGAVVALVIPGSPAEQAGVREGDQIVRLGDQPVRNYFDWESRLLDLRVGDQPALRVKRGSAERDLTVRIADLPEVSAQKVQVLKDMDLVTVTPAIKAQRGIRSRGGALAVRVSQNLTAQWGIQTNDVIVQINRSPISSANDVADAFERYAGRGNQEMFIERSGTLFRIIFAVQ